MILTCPSCSSRYHVDAAAFKDKPRKVRCANCGHRWKAEPPADLPRPVEIEVDEPEATATPAPPPAAEPAPERPDERVKAQAAAAVGGGAKAGATVAPRRPMPSFEASLEASRRKKSPVGWLLGAGVVVLLLVSAIIGRQGIVGKFPAMASVYQAVGLSVDQDFGLEFADVTLDWQREDGAFVLVVEGQIVNLSDANQDIPPVRMAILDGDGRELQHEYFEVGESEISAGNRIAFSGRMVDPIDQGENFRLTFGQDS